MTADLIQKLSTLQVDDVEGISVLLEHRVDIATLKYYDAPAFEKLRAHWKARGVERLPQLDKAIDGIVRDVLKKEARATRQGSDGFLRGADGTIIGNPDNIRTGIQKLGVTLRYDAFRGWPVITGMPDGFGPSLDDASLDRLWLWLGEEFAFQPSQSLFRTVASDMCMLNQFHPVRDYLDRLEWDGTERIDTWLSTYCHTDDTPYTRAVGALVLVAAARRVREPGAKFDEMLILESAEQGFSKSTLIEAMAVNDDWYSDSVPLNADDKTMIERSSGKWICEVGELQGMRKGEVEKIRAQLSRRYDRARLAYARLPVEIPRQSVLVGSTNADRNAPYLADINGNRRFWPVNVGRCDVEAFTRDRDQIWAEAAAREATGTSIRLPENLWAAARKEQGDRAIGNSFEDVLGPYLGDLEGLIWADDAWRLLRIPVERRDSHAGKFGRAMKALGWERANRRRGGTQAWAYVKGDGKRRLFVTEDRLDRSLDVGYADVIREVEPNSESW
ncbi:MAG TPA: virulence-associated E family protein [Devosia sp.]|jgi:hypothetical protein|uniref:virulence-associated E family protein n=1 Tax=Devosia sp. TaxID=1871048 RepID=UPI002DDDB4B7|nr:virulence-associated E family protein [Devosia sp.]HEV2515152.1 virulence-associated E family protein [Devosia sp.]